MAQTAPTTPTTELLHALYPIGEVTQLRIDLARERIGNILSGEESGTVAIVGACAMTGDTETIRREGHAQHEVTQRQPGLYVVHRRPTWKPRTNPGDWHGLETTEPELAYRTLAMEAMWGAGVAIELGQPYHAERYGHLLTLGWFGGRNVAKGDLMTAAATQNPTLPLAVKNGLDGDIKPALTKVRMLTDLRGDGAAPVVLLYRGGENATDPNSWERQYRDALEVTGGRMIVDVAHGSEMAHDPDGSYKKSVEGQKRALDHILAIAALGETSNGIMAEASDADSPTDPHIGHQHALEKVISLSNIRRALATSRV